MTVWGITAQGGVTWTGGERMSRLSWHQGVLFSGSQYNVPQVPEAILVTSTSCPNDLTSLDTVTMSRCYRRYHTCWLEICQVILAPKKRWAWVMPDTYCQDCLSSNPSPTNRQHLYMRCYIIPSHSNSGV